MHRYSGHWEGADTVGSSSSVAGPASASASPSGDGTAPLRFIDFCGLVGDVNAAGGHAVRRFAAWLRSKAADLTAGMSTDAAGRFRASVAALERLEMLVEWGAGFTVEHRWPGVEAGAGVASLVVRLYTFDGAVSVFSPAKAENGWDVTDFWLGSADPVSGGGSCGGGGAAPQRLCETALPCEWAGRQQQLPSTGFTAGRDGDILLSSFAAVVAAGARAVSHWVLEKPVPLSSDSLGSQLAAHMTHVLRVVEGTGATGMTEVADAVLQGLDQRGGQRTTPPPPARERHPRIGLDGRSSDGWQLFVALCERVMAPALSADAFADALALWCVELVAPTNPTATSADLPDGAVLQYLLNYLSRRVASVSAVGGGTGRGGGAAAPSLLPLLLSAVRHLDTVVKTAGAGGVLAAPPPATANSAAAAAFDGAGETLGGAARERYSTIHRRALNEGEVVVEVKTQRLVDQAAELLRCCSGGDAASSGAPRQEGLSCPDDTIGDAIVAGLTPREICLRRDVEEVFLSHLLSVGTTEEEEGEDVAGGGGGGGGRDDRRNNSNNDDDDSMAKLRELKGLVEPYEAACRQFMHASLDNGYAWIDEPSIAQAVAVLRLTVAVEASRVMRREYPALRGFTLVPVPDLWDELLSGTLVLSTTMKGCVVELYRVLSEEEERHGKHLVHNVEEALVCLSRETWVQERILTPLNDWKEYAWAQAEESLQEYETNRSAMAEMDQWVRERGRREHGEHAHIQRKIEGLASRSYPNAFLPFSEWSPAQQMAWVLPSELSHLLDHAFHIHEFLTGASTGACPDVRSCVYHNPNKERAPRPYHFRAFGVPKWLHLLDTPPFYLSSDSHQATATAASADGGNVRRKGSRERHPFLFCPTPAARFEISGVLDGQGIDREKFFINPTAVRPPPPLLSASSPSPYKGEEAVKKAAELYGRFHATHTTARLRQKAPSARENLSYCLPPLHGALSKEQWAEVYSIRSHPQTQTSRLLVALRGRCARLADLFETDFVLQHYLVTLLSDVTATIMADAEEARVTFPIAEKDIPQCLAGRAQMLFFYSALYATCYDAEVRRSVQLACVSRATELSLELQERCKGAAVGLGLATPTEYKALYRVATIGLACLGLLSRDDAQSEPLAQRLFADGAELALCRGQAQVVCGDDAVCPLDTLADAGFYALAAAQEAQQQQSRQWQNAIFTALWKVYTIRFSHEQIAWAPSTGALRYHGEMLHTRQRCEVDLVRGTVLIDGKAMGDILDSIMEAPLYSELIGKGVTVAVSPLPVSSWYKSNGTLPLNGAAGNGSGGGQGGGASASLLFSTSHDIGLYEKGDGYHLAVLWSESAVLMDVGGGAYFHLVGRFVSDGGDAADVVLLKPKRLHCGDDDDPAADTSPWIRRQRDRAEVHYVAVRRVTAARGGGRGPLEDLSSRMGLPPFNLYVVPYSMRSSPVSADLLSRVAQWERVVTDASTRSTVAKLFPVSSIAGKDLLLTIPPRWAAANRGSAGGDGDGGAAGSEARVVSVAVPGMDLRFSLTDHSLQTRGGYVLHGEAGDSGGSTTVPWLRGAVGAANQFLLLVKDRDARARVRAAFREPDQKILWVAGKPDGTAAAAAAAAECSVIEVWRHHHFRFLEARSTAERLRLCALLLDTYPLHFQLSSDPIDGSLTVLEEVCGLLRRCVSNRPFTEVERDAFEVLWAVVVEGGARLGHSAWILRTWLRYLRRVRDEVACLTSESGAAANKTADRRGGGGGGGGGGTEAARRREANLDAHAEQYVRRLMLRHLLPHRCMLPPELVVLTPLECVYPTAAFLSTTAQMRERAAASGEAVAQAVRSFTGVVEAAAAALSSVRERRQGRWLPFRGGGGAGDLAPEVREALGDVASARARLITLLTALPELSGIPSCDDDNNDDDNKDDDDDGGASHPPSGRVAGRQRRSTHTAAAVRALHRTCRAHPEATITLQDVGQVSIRGVCGWVEGMFGGGAAGGQLVSWPATVVAAVEEACRVYVEACVIQDWLERLLIALQEGSSRHTAEVELSSPRDKIREHRSWLVFEAEQRLAIRQEQYATWQMMWASVTARPGGGEREEGLITQLNMGEGKTRVIVPMLLLSELERDGEGGADTAAAADIPCVHALPAVAGELRRYLHEALNSPGLCVRVLAKTFSRSVAMTPAVVAALMSSFQRFRQRAAIVEQREHFVSFIQKREEELLLLQDGGFGASSSPRPMGAAGGDRVQPPTPAALFGPRALHIFDEADELLSCHYNLVYSVGRVAKLSECEMRCGIAAHLLDCCAQIAVEHPHFFDFTEPSYVASSGAGRGVAQVRFPPCHLKGTADQSEFSDKVLARFFKSPPSDYAWMGQQQRSIVHFVTARASVSKKDLSSLQGMQETMVEQVMCLRGYIQHGLLFFCLGQRLNVNFGLPPPTRSTRMAVPYVAADVPSERSEFAQPDVAIMLTYLAYMHNGLTLKQFRHALSLLWQLSEVQRQREYDRWIDSWEPEPGRAPVAVGEGHHRNSDNEEEDDDDEDEDTIMLKPTFSFPRLAALIDLDDAALIERMFLVLRRRMAVVAFWATKCVIAPEGRYHSHLLRATAWDIASQQRMVGFSGTKDGCRLLPSSVAFREHCDEAICGTTRRMSELIAARATGRVAVLGSSSSSSSGGAASSSNRNSASSDDNNNNSKNTVAHTQAEQYVRDAIAVHGCDVLVDAGALLVGTSPRATAQLIASQLESGVGTGVGSVCKGVCYFDHEGAAHASWVVMDLGTRHVAPLEEASLTPAECFVVYDQARCRGSDLRLRHGAKALLSLTRGLRRDDLLQAVGRLREYGKGQSVVFVAPSSVLEEMAPAAGAAEVLSWVQRNTEEAMRQAIPEYVSAAAHHLHKMSVRGREVVAVPSPTACSDLYCVGRGTILGGELVRTELEPYQSMPVARAIQDRVVSLAGDTEVQARTAAGATTERENEVQVIPEEEREVEEEAVALKPFAEPYADVARGPPALKMGCRVDEWCSMITGMAGFGKVSGVSLYFACSFHHIVKDVDGARKQQMAAVLSGSAPLRQPRYILADPDDRSFSFLTYHQAAVLLYEHEEAGLVILHNYSPFVFLSLPPPTARGGGEGDHVQFVVKVQRFLLEVLPPVLMLAGMYGGDSDFPMIASKRVGRVLSEVVRVDGGHGSARQFVGSVLDDRLLFFHRHRGTAVEVRGSMLEKAALERANQQQQQQ